MQKNIVFEDEHIIVAYKPAGIATQTARLGQQDMVSELKNYLQESRRTRVRESLILDWSTDWISRSAAFWCLPGHQKRQRRWAVRLRIRACRNIITQ